MKTLILSSAFLVLLASSATGTAADCYRINADLLPTLPAGATLQPGGYHCVDHRGQYVELSNGSELRIPSRGAPRVTARPDHRLADLAAQAHQR